MTNKPQILLSEGYHNAHNVVCIRFKYDQQVINRLKKVTTATWSSSERCWYIQQADFKLSHFFEQFRDLAYIDYSALKSTIKSYTAYFKDFMHYFSDRGLG